jgi:hypothetical protein
MAEEEAKTVRSASLEESETTGSHKRTAKAKIRSSAGGRVKVRHKSNFLGAHVAHAITSHIEHSTGSEYSVLYKAYHMY